MAPDPNRASVASPSRLTLELNRALICAVDMLVLFDSYYYQYDSTPSLSAMYDLDLCNSVATLLGYGGKREVFCSVCHKTEVNDGWKPM